MSTQVDPLESGASQPRADYTAPDAAYLEAHLRNVQAREEWNRLERQLLELEHHSPEPGNVDWRPERVDEGPKFGASEGAVSTPPSSGPIVRARPNGLVGSVMDPGAPCCAVDHSLNAAAQLMWESGAVMLPVVDHGMQLVGVLTDRDVAMGAYTQGCRLADCSVQSAMRSNALSCSTQESLQAGLAKFDRTSFVALPVVNDDGCVVGVVSERGLRDRVGQS